MTIWASEGVLAAAPRRELANDEAVELVISRLDFSPDALAAAASLLSPDERQRVGRFSFERERNQFIVIRARLRQLLGERIGIRPSGVQFVYGQYGKPALAPCHAAHGLSFNLSRSHDLAVFAFASGGQIGVDIEQVRPISTAAHIAAQFFSPSEQGAFEALAPEDRAQGFFNAWTRKEALIKALGEGLYHPLDAFDISLAPDLPARICRLGEVDGEACGWKLRSFQPAAGFVGAVVVEDLAAARHPPASIKLH